jgi:hypothetical protein
MAADLELQVVILTPEVGTSGLAEFEIQGIVTGADSQGLALFGVDVTVTATGGYTVDHDLDMTVSAPAGDIANYFVGTAGLNNPAGFGGTPTAAVDSLMQVGGAENTIHNVAPPAAPSAWPIATGVAQDALITLASGTIQMNSAPDGTVVTVAISDGFANVLDTYNAGQDFWEVAQATVSYNPASADFTVTGVGAVINSVGSCRDHAGTEYCLDIGSGGRAAGDNIEPRTPGTLQLKVTASAAVDPGSTAASVSCWDLSGPVTYTPDAGYPLVTADGTAVVTVDFSPALPDQTCCEVVLRVASRIAGT